MVELGWVFCSVIEFLFLVWVVQIAALVGRQTLEIEKYDEARAVKYYASILYFACGGPDLREVSRYFCSVSV